MFLFSESTWLCPWLLFTAVAYVIDLSSVPGPANTEPSQRSCSVDSCWRNILSLIFQLQVSFFFLLLHVFFSLNPPLFLPLFDLVCLCVFLSLFLSSFIYLSSLLLSQHLLVPCELLPSPSFTFFSLFTLLTISSSTLDCLFTPLGLSNPQNWDSKRCDTLILIFQLFLCRMLSGFSSFQGVDPGWRMSGRCFQIQKPFSKHQGKAIKKVTDLQPQETLVAACLFLFFLFLILGNKLVSSRWNFLLQMRVKQLLILVSMESTLLGSEEASEEMSLAVTSHQPSQRKQ